MNNRFIPLIAVAVVAISTCLPATAQPLPRWEVGAGVASLTNPDYRGAEHYNFRAFPVPYLVYRGERLRVTRDGFSARLFGSDRLLLNLSLAVSLPGSGDAADSPRAGMPKLLSTFELGPSLDYWLYEPRSNQWNWRLRLPVRSVAATNFQKFEQAGWLAHPYLQLSRGTRIGSWSAKFSASLGAVWATRQYHSYFYEVDPQYATPDRPAYEAGGGYSGARGSLYLGLSRGPWRIGLGVVDDWLAGASFMDSPLVQTRNAAVIAFGIAYRFWASDKMVEVDDAP
jgi:outer membrane scaffolding protein for murein synthesis (MipA/OmpV family)